MARPIRTLSISSEQRRALRAIVNRPSAAHRDNRRAWIILNRADGLSQTETARKVGVRQSVVGQDLDPPDRALVLGCDEKSQCQALERTQPSLPVMRGYRRTQTHDYKRHGTVTLFAGLSYLDGKIFSQTAAKHTHRQWLAFMKQLDRETPEDLTLHVIADNYSTHKHAKVKSWVQWRNQRQRKAFGLDRLVIHFIPTSSSWMNLVERFFRDITEDVVRDGRDRKSTRL